MITRYLPDLENSSVSFLEDFLFVIKFFGPVVAFMRVHFNIYFNINDASPRPSVFPRSHKSFEPGSNDLRGLSYQVSEIIYIGIGTPKTKIFENDADSFATRLDETR